MTPILNFNKSAKLAIVIPTARWNARAKSLLASTVGIANEEIVVLIGDNSENPEKKDFLQKIKKLNRNIFTTVHKKNIGAFNNFSFLLEQCKEIEFCAVIGDDDWMTPCYFPSALETLKKNPNASCCETGTALADFGDGKHVNISQPSMVGTSMLERLKNWSAIIARVTMYNASKRSAIQAALEYQKATPLHGLTMAENLWELNRLALGDFLSVPASSYFIHYPAHSSKQGGQSQRFYNLLCKDAGLALPALDFMDLSSAIQCALFLMGKCSPLQDTAQGNKCGQAVFRHIYTKQFFPKFINIDKKEKIFSNIADARLSSRLQEYISPAFSENPILDDGLISLFIDLMDRFQVEQSVPRLRPKLKDFFDELLPLGVATPSFDELSFPITSEALSKEVHLSNTTYNMPDYPLWQSKRTMIAEEILAIEDQLALATPFKFHLCIRLLPGDETRLADTIDSLSGQFYPDWHLDIITELPSPDGLSGIPCIGWHSTAAVNHKSVIDNLIDARECDWCIEIPAGAKLDPLYLWRLSIEIPKMPDVRCFFVDDDCFDESSKTSYSPRFKPGSNPSALESSDLAGPICTSRDTWKAIGGASIRSTSPWFSQLLRTARHFGWKSIQHIPDILISYPNAFPSDPASCTMALLEHLDYANTKTEIIPVTGDSWAFRHPLKDFPKVTIAIISTGRLDLLTRCLDGIRNKTDYPSSSLELFTVLNHFDDDQELEQWLRINATSDLQPVRSILTPRTGNRATRCNAALRSASGEFTVLIDEEAFISEPTWLIDLVGTCAQKEVGGTTPCLVRPEANTIHQAGLVLGMTEIAANQTAKISALGLQANIATNGVVAQLYEKNAMHNSTGYLNLIKSPRDVSAISGTCMLVRTKPCLDAGGMDEEILGNDLADIDLSLRLRAQGWRLIYQPLATVQFGDISDIRWTTEPITRTKEMQAQALAKKTFLDRWWPSASIDAYWNPNLSLLTPTPTPEITFLAQWQYLPMNQPRILARPLSGGQGIIRLNTPLEALRKGGLAQVSLYPQTTDDRAITPAELLRLAPDAVIMHHYLNNRRLPELEAWHATPGRPFLVFAMDDLLTGLDDTNPFKKNMTQDTRSRLKEALTHCDRLVVSTDYLAEHYRSLIKDIRIVPNLLQQKVWLPLRSQQRTTPKPRIGWAGGTTHQGDLALLKEIIEQTRHEADWIFFGMCPEEIRPLLAEYHPLIPISEYPARLASLNLDIAVAPLAPTPFNRGKSNLRLLEYGILGLPVVCTDIDPYHNSPACRVNNNPEAWVAALRERIYDADAREYEGRAMREWVQKHYLLENNLHEWLDAHLPD